MRCAERRNGGARQGRTEGFSLLEVMIALAIISIALVALLGLGNRSILVHERLQRITQATLLAQQLMAETEIRAQNQGAQGLVETGTFEDPFAAYRWQIGVTETPLPAVRQVTVTVLWGDEERNELVDLTSFLF